jgi:hypothetical protein
MERSVHARGNMSDDDSPGDSKTKDTTFPYLQTSTSKQDSFYIQQASLDTEATPILPSSTTHPC